jgi:dTDP-4-amino-4,6-dideoxygalactose transaminase
MNTQLAIQGGPKTVTNKLQGWPQFDDKAINAVTAVLRSGKVNYWTGKQGMAFEKKFAEW